ncbi:MAG: hypothetical protein K1X53_13985 [Candidatus Sumerlaeaceae bacterium]|nr:hypothetical protein [Candidatus Sumerlaeaceae bacterium]
MAFGKKQAKPTQKDFLAIDNRLAICKEYTRLWQEYFKFFSDSLVDKKISDRDEQAFMQIVNVLASNHFRYVEMVGDYFKGGDDILKVLTDTVSLNTLKTMSDAQFSKLQIEWHTLFIAMNKAIGKLNALVPPPVEPKAGKKAAAA